MAGGGLTATKGALSGDGARSGGFFGFGSTGQRGGRTKVAAVPMNETLN